MSSFPDMLTQAIPLEQVRKGIFDLDLWVKCLHKIEQWLLQSQTKIYAAAQLIESIIPLYKEGLYLRVIHNGVNVEGIAIYEKSISYRIFKSYNHHILSFSTHKVNQIKGIYVTEIQITKKENLFSQNL